MYGVFHYEFCEEDLVAVFASKEKVEDYMYYLEGQEGLWSCDSEEEGYFVRPVSQEEVEAFMAEADAK